MYGCGKRMCNAYNSSGSVKSTSALGLLVSHAHIGRVIHVHSYLFTSPETLG